MKIVTNIISFLADMCKLIWVRENPKFAIIVSYKSNFKNNQKATPNFKELNLVGII